MCGDHYSEHLPSYHPWGSPPHVRGPLNVHYVTTGKMGITPACAGTTFMDLIYFTFYRDHPRMCGDHLKAEFILTICEGSPPHVRGPLISYFSLFKLMGITPACAGTTFISSSLAVSIWDHPRMCGDHYLIKQTTRNLPGSPPHVRGPRNWFN